MRSPTWYSPLRTTSCQPSTCASSRLSAFVCGLMALIVATGTIKLLIRVPSFFVEACMKCIHEKLPGRTASADPLPIDRGAPALHKHCYDQGIAGKCGRCFLVRAGIQPGERLLLKRSSLPGEQSLRRSVRYQG